jgi:hypothetical protein
MIITTAERVQAAKEKTDRIVDHLLYLIALHESNAVVVYSDTLSKQMPRSYAAHAFNVFRQCMSHFEIVRLCALWDSPRSNQKSIPTEETIPTLVELINDLNVINALAAEARASSLVGVHDPSLVDISQALKKRARQNADKARRRLKKCIKTAQKIEHSALLDSVRNLRSKHLAHSLSETRREQKGRQGALPPVLPVKYGDERKLLLDSLTLVKELHPWVKGGDFLFDHSRDIARRNAEELWKHCTFSVPRRDEPRGS